jgi:hypothetical protein
VYGQVSAAERTRGRLMDVPTGFDEALASSLVLWIWTLAPFDNMSALPSIAELRRRPGSDLLDIDDEE